MSPLPPATGTVLRDPDSSLARYATRILVVVAVVVVGLAVFGGRGPALAIAVIGLAAAAVFGRHRLTAMFAWQSPQLEVSASAYDLGSAPIVVYRRKPKRVIDIASCTVQCRLVCEERATYTNGSDTTTDTRRVYEHDCSAPGEGTAEGLVAEIELPISAHAGAPSFSLPHNKVRWFVEIRVDGQRLPRDRHTFSIAVGAALDPSHRAGVQDS